MYFLEGSHLSYPELNNCCVKEDIIIIIQDTYCIECYAIVCVKRMPNSLVNSFEYLAVRTWQEVNEK